MRFKILLFFILLIMTQITFGQKIDMRPLSTLINKEEPGWDLVKEWIKAAKNLVEVLPKDSTQASTTLYQTQVTTRSPMGAIIFETGGILVDHGWIRILGSGNERLSRSIIEWNKNKSFTEIGEAMPFLLIADDVLGGFFAINSGGLSTKGIGKVFYFSPDVLEWEDTQMGYSDFLTFCFSGDLNKFYKGYRWTNWRNDIQEMDGNKGMSIFPFLWTKEGKQNIDKSSKKAVPLQELWDLYINDPKKASK